METRYCPPVEWPLCKSYVCDTLVYPFLADYSLHVCVHPTLSLLFLIFDTESNQIYITSAFNIHENTVKLILLAIYIVIDGAEARIKMIQNGLNLINSVKIANRYLNSRGHNREPTRCWSKVKPPPGKSTRRWSQSPPHHLFACTAPPSHHHLTGIIFSNHGLLQDHGVGTANHLW